MKKIKDLNTYFYINQAIYKSGRYVVTYEDAIRIVREYTNKDIYFTPIEFIDALREDLCDNEKHLILGGRNSKNPIMILYGNYNTKSQRDKYFPNNSTKLTKKINLKKYKYT